MHNILSILAIILVIYLLLPKNICGCKSDNTEGQSNMVAAPVRRQYLSNASDDSDDLAISSGMGVSNNGTPVSADLQDAIISHKNFTDNATSSSSGASSMSVLSSSVYPNPWVGLSRPDRLLNAVSAGPDARVVESENAGTYDQSSNTCWYF